MFWEHRICGNKKTANRQLRDKPETKPIITRDQEWIDGKIFARVGDGSFSILFATVENIVVVEKNHSENGSKVLRYAKKDVYWGF